MAAISKRIVAVVAAFVTAVAVGLTLLVGNLTKEGALQDRSVGVEETSLLAEGRERQTRQLSYDDEYYMKLRDRYCPQRVMEDTYCDQYNSCEGTKVYCLLRRCCCLINLCDCSRAVCKAIPEAVKICENQGKCTADCRVQFFHKGVDITNRCENSTREEIEEDLVSTPCRENCPFQDKPCLITSCVGSPDATCENRCNGECDVRYTLSGVDITGYCYSHPATIQSYVKYIQKLQGITDGLTDTEDGDQGEDLGSGSGSVSGV